MERFSKDTGGFLSTAFGEDTKDEQNRDDEFLLIDDGEEADNEYDNIVPNSVPSTPQKEAAPTLVRTAFSDNHTDEDEPQITLEPVRFDDNDNDRPKQQRPTKSAMKKSSSYGCLTDEIPICMKDSSYKTLPKPVKRSQSTASFFPPPESPRIKRNVSFSKVSMRTFPLMLGDNPSVSYGMPTTLAWNHIESTTLELDSYEEHRAPRRSPREMLMSHYQRKAILTNQGYTEQELKQAKRQAEKAKRQRNSTRSLMPLMKLEDLAESTARKAKRVVKRSNSGNSLALTRSADSSSNSLAPVGA